MTINRDTARRYTTRARAAAIVLLVAAGAVIALPLPALRPASGAALPGPDDQTTPGELQAPAYEPPIDTMAATTVLWGHGVPPSVEEAAPPPVAAGPANGAAPGVATPPTPPPTGWRYLGSIVGPRGMHALLEHNGQQKLLKVGDAAGEARVVTIEAAEVVLEENGATKKIALAPQTSRWTTSTGSQTVVGGRTAPAARVVGPSGVPGRPVVQPPRPMIPQPRAVGDDGMSDEEREKYEKYEKARESGEDGGGGPVDGGFR